MRAKTATVQHSNEMHRHKHRHRTTRLRRLHTHKGQRWSRNCRRVCLPGTAGWEDDCCS